MLVLICVHLASSLRRAQHGAHDESYDGTTTAQLFATLKRASDLTNQSGAGRQLSFRHVTKYGASFWLAVGPTGPAEQGKYSAALPAGGINNKLYQSGRFHEHAEAKLVQRILESQCALHQRTGTTRGLVVDVGANSGFFTLLGAAHGCNVISMEPNKAWAALVNLSVAANGFASRVTLHNAVATNERNVVFNGWEVAHDTASTYQTKGKKRSWASPQGSVRLDDVLPPGQPIVYLKIDTQGHEGPVLASAQRVLLSGLVRFIFLEVTFTFMGEARFEKALPHIRLLAEQLQYQFYLPPNSPLLKASKNQANLHQGRKYTALPSGSRLLGWLRDSASNLPKTTYAAADLIAVHPSSHPAWERMMDLSWH